jgi:2'-5' RNA ligase
MHTYVVISSFDKHPKQNYTLRDLPLHLTLSNIFYSDLTTVEIMARLKPLTHKFKQFEVTAKSREMFGPQQDVPVTEIIKSEQLQDMHKGIAAVLGEDMKYQSPEFAGANYRPHVSDQPAGIVAINEKLTVNNLTFVEIMGDEIVVHGVYDLG